MTDDSQRKVDEPRSYMKTVAAAMPILAFRAAAGGMPILMGLLIAHRWGLGELAPYTVANAMIAIALVVADWGSTRALPRNLAVLAPGEAARLLASANAVRFLLVGLMALIGAGAAGMGWIAGDVSRYLAVLFVLCPLWVVATNAISERIVVRQTRAIGAGVAAGLSIFVVLGAIVIYGGGGPRLLVAAYVAGKAVEVLFLAGGRWWVIFTARGGMWSTARALVPFSAQMIMAALYSRAAVFTVERMTTRAELGVFSVAAALQGALLLAPASLGLVYFPELARLSRDREHARIRALLGRYVLISTAAVAGGIAVLLGVAPALTTVLKVPPAGVPLVVAFSALAFLSIFTTMAGFLMQARGEERTVARLSVVTLSLSLAYQLAALSFLGLWGIVAAVAAAEITTAVVFGIAIGRSRTA